jgi:hypothetical protein
VITPGRLPVELCSLYTVAIFPMLLKPAAEKLKKIWDFLIRSSSRVISPG